MFPVINLIKIREHDKRWCWLAGRQRRAAHRCGSDPVLQHVLSAARCNKKLNLYTLPLYARHRVQRIAIATAPSVYVMKRQGFIREQILKNQLIFKIKLLPKSILTILLTTEIYSIEPRLKLYQ